MKRLMSACVVVAAAVLAACSSTPRAPTGAAAIPSPEGVEDCLFFRTVDDWAPIDRQRLIIYGIGRVPYLATLNFPSVDLQFDFAVAFVDYDRDGRLCGRSFDAVQFRDGIPDRIAIDSLKRISKEDAKQLLAAAHPKRKSRKMQQITGEAPVGQQPKP